MEIIHKDHLNIIIEKIKQGLVCVLPSESSYGLCCDATNQEAVDKIFKIKSRSKDKPLLVVVPDRGAAKKYIEWTDFVEQHISKYWPGPLTIVAKAKEGDLAKGVISEENTLAIRVTSDSVLIKISELCAMPLVATSANISGEKEIYDSAEVVELYKDRELKPDCVLDWGRIEPNRPSTLVSVLNDKMDILRQGELEIKE